MTRGFDLEAAVPLLAAALAAFLATGAAGADDGDQTTMRRFAIVVGANDGGPSRVKLRYAHKDARAVDRVLRQLGGVSGADSILLIEPSRAGLEAGFEQMRKKLAAAEVGGVRMELVFYFSGHSDEQGLLLKGERFKYSDIRQLIGEMPADVRIAVLDSCASGALTRGKGGTRKPPFLLDSSTDVRGTAILTSSSADEAAQESERVGGSFFTHYLVSGLRGAADSSRDGRITLNEAYHYAFNETLARTESTAGGAQHPNYDIQLAGSGDLVLTDLRGTSAVLVLPKELEGRLFIRDANGNLVAEINKAAGAPMSLGLEPGDYDVTLERDPELRRGRVKVSQGAETLLDASTLELVAAESTVARGDGAAEGEAKEQEIHHRPVSLGLAPYATTDGGAEGPVLNNFSLNLIGWGDYLKGLEISSIGSIRRNDVTGLEIGGVFNYVHGDVRGLQIGGVTNVGLGELRGVGIGGLVNVSGGDSVGLRIGGLANVTTGDASTGLDIGGVTNVVTGGSRGLQIAGVANVAANGELDGLTIGGVANVAGGSDPSHGLQVAGVTSVLASEQFTGAQIAGVVNVAGGDVCGMQLGGVVNVGGDVRGLQIGTVNIATERMRGVQIGVFNYAGDGIFAPVLFGGDTAMLNLGLKTGSRYVYSLVGGGLHPVGGTPRSSFFAGLGGHIELTPVWVEIDGLYHWLQPDFTWSDYASMEQIRIAVGYRFLDRVSLFVGPTYNIVVSEKGEIDAGPIPPVWSDTRDGTYIEMGFGFFGGVQYEPGLGNLNSH